MYKGDYGYSRGIVRDYIHQDEKQRILDQNAEDLNYYREFDSESEAHTWLADLFTDLFCEDEDEY